MKNKFLNLQEAFDGIRKKRFSFLDRVDFYQILLAWFFLIVIIGALYYFFLGRLGANLVSTIGNQSVHTFADALYFSFITATSTGFGDIVPVGFFKILAIAEVTLGLLLLALVTSKLVSIKQDAILEEIYDMSFREKINRLRSSLLVFRQNASRIITHVEASTVDKREVHELYVYIHSLETVLEEMLPMLSQDGKHIFTKVIDPMSSELLINSVMQSLERLVELLNTLSKSTLAWKRPITIATIKRCLSLNRQLFSQLIVSQKKLAGINETIADNEKMVKEIEKLIFENEIKVILT
ncbi:MAG: potassium channel family protein [Nanoarchaeota archaeon]|nr:potassium channel family protein [Nanoarchaeota archaeon]